MSGPETMEFVPEKSETVNCHEGDECQIVRSNKGGPKLVHRGYIYTVHKQRPGTVRWRCTRRSLCCKGSLTTRSINPGTKAKVLMPHNHIPDGQAFSRTIGWAKEDKRMLLHHNGDTANEGDTSALEPPELELMEDLPPEHKGQNQSQFNRLKNLGTNVKVQTLNHPHQHHDYYKKRPEGVDDQVNLDKDCKLRIHDQVKPKKKPTSEVKHIPVKVSKRILEKKMMRLSAPAAAFNQEVNNKPTLPELQPVYDPLQTPQTATVEEDEVCLKWNSHHNNMQTAFPFLLAREQYVDVTLCCDGQSIRCHKLVLSSCSSYFDDMINGVLPWQHPVIYLRGIPFWVLKALIDFMYVGEVSIEQSKLQMVMMIGEELKIKGLTTRVMPQQLQPFSPSQLPSVRRSFSTESNKNEVYSSVPSRDLRETMKVTKFPSQDDVLQSAQDINKDEKPATTSAPLMPVITSVMSGHEVQQQEQGKKKQQELLVQVPKVKDEVIPDSSREKQSKANKRTSKRRLSEMERDPVINENLLFMRKGTRSRPLVKTPKMYQDFLPKTKSERIDSSARDSRGSKESRDRQTPVSTNEETSNSSVSSTPQKVYASISHLKSVDKRSLLKTSSVSSGSSKLGTSLPTISLPVVAPDDYLNIVQIKQEPIDIGETDVTYGGFQNEGQVLLFDNSVRRKSDTDAECEPFITLFDNNQNVDDDEEVVDEDGDNQEVQEFMEVVSPTLEIDLDDDPDDNDDGVIIELEHKNVDELDESVEVPKLSYREMKRRIGKQLGQSVLSSSAINKDDVGKTMKEVSCEMFIED